MSIRRILRPAALVATLALAMAGLITSGAPAGAAPGNGNIVWFASTTTSDVLAVQGGRRATLSAFPTQKVLAGHFDGNSAFLYNPGSGPDGLVTTSDDGTTITPTLTPMPVSGVFSPFVGDFDGNGHDDIFWYAPGAAPDYLWFFHDGGAHTSVATGVQRSYTPVPFVVDHTGRTAILWYARGTGTDQLWTFGADGRHHDLPGGVDIDGDYTPVVGHFTWKEAGKNRDEVLWYDRSGHQSWLWSFDPTGATHRSTKLPAIGRGYRPSVHPISGFDMHVAFFYRPGPGSERLWIWSDNGQVASDPRAEIDGTYPTVTDSQGHGPNDGPILIGPGPSAKSLQLNPESAPGLYDFTKIPDVPPHAVGTVATYLALV